MATAKQDDHDPDYDYEEEAQDILGEAQVAISEALDTDNVGDMEASVKRLRENDRYRLLCDAQGQPFESWRQFCTTPEPHGLGRTPEAIDGARSDVPPPPVSVVGTAVRPHPAANLFPMMRGDDFKALVEDIEEHGLIHPIVIHDGQILDGRNRLKACKQAGVAPRFTALDGCESPVSYVMSTNSTRRHLSVAQRAFVAADALSMYEAEAKARQGRRTDNEQHPGKIAQKSGRARDRAAADVGVSGRYVGDAKRIQRDAPEVADLVRDGKATLPEAHHLADLPPELRRTAVKAIEDGAPPKDALAAARPKQTDKQRAAVDTRRRARAVVKALKEAARRHGWGLSDHKTIGPVLNAIFEL